MYSSDIEYIPTNRFSMSLLDYFGSSFITMKLQIPHAENADELRTLLNKYSIVHWCIDKDDDAHTVFRSNLSQNNMNQIIVKKIPTPSMKHLKNEPDDILIRELESRGYVITRKDDSHD